MENYLNILHFFFHKAHYNLHLLSKKLNPFRLLFKLPIVKKKAEKEGVNLDEAVDKAFGDKNFGLSITIAGGMLWGGSGIFFFSLFLLLNIPISMPYYSIACGILSGVICYYFVFKNDKYLEYFNKYEKWSKSERRKYSLLTLASVSTVFLLFYLGLKS